MSSGVNKATVLPIAYLDDLVHGHRVQGAEQLVAPRGGECSSRGLAVAQGDRVDEPRAVREAHIVLDVALHPPGQRPAPGNLDVPRPVAAGADVDNAAARQGP